MEPDRYSYRVTWSAEDGEFVATCDEFPSLSWLDADAAEALRRLKEVVSEAVADLRASGRHPPPPLAERDEIVLRLDPEVRRRLAAEAAEARTSLDRYVAGKLQAAS